MTSKKTAARSTKSSKSGTSRKSSKSSKGSSKDPDKGDDKGSKATETKEPPGSLTVNCSPACDSVVAGGRSLGPSPVINQPMPAGQHRVTLKRSGVASKTVVVDIKVGQLTSQRVSMK